VKRTLIYALLFALVPALLAGCGGTPTALPEPTASLPAATEAPTAEPTATSLPPTPAPPAEATPASKPAGSFSGYESEDLGFSLEYPEAWQIVERQSLNTVAFVTSASGVEGEFRANLSVGVQDLGSPQISLQAYSDLFLQQAPAQIDSFELIESEPALLDGLPAHRVVYSGMQYGLPLQWLQVWTLAGGRAYIVTYTAEVSPFDEFLDEVHYIISTIEIAPGEEA
jgi:hypothetical protein